METKIKKSSYVFPFVAAMFWGSVYIFSGIAMETLTSYELAFFRYAGGALVLFLIIKLKGISLKVQKEHIKSIWIIGFFGYFASIEINMLAITYAGPVISSLLNSLTPIGIMIAAMIILKEKVPLKTWIMIGVALVGVAIVSMGGEISVRKWFGLILVFVGIGFWSIASCHMRKIGGGYPPFVITFWGMLVSMAFQIPVMIGGILIKGSGLAAPGSGLAGIILAGLPVFNTRTLLAIIYMAIFGTAVAQSVWNMGLSRLPASVCSMFYPVQPLFSAILGVVLGTDKITVRLVIGGVIIAAAIIIALSPGRKKLQIT